MHKLLEVFSLEVKSLVRSKALAMLTVVSVAWMFLFPYLAKGDGTVAGSRELYVHYSLGGVFILLVLSLLSSATASLARERAARRLQLTLVRPVRYSVLVYGKILAHLAAGALVLVVSAIALAVNVDLSTPCSHVLSPILPTPREEALSMYDSYMKDPETPEGIRRAKKEIVLRLLEQRAVDHYQVAPTNESVTWRFLLPAKVAPDSIAVRLRFTNQYEMRQDLLGDFVLGESRGTVSNITQAVVTVPLGVQSETGRQGVSGETLSFFNRGRSALMIRPRKDIHLLIPADAFGWNLLRAVLVLLAMLTLVVSFGIFLSAGLGRPVALFVAFVTLLVSEMSPSVVEQYPDGLETNTIDHVGLCLTRFAMQVTHPLSAASPLDALSKDECVESSSVWRSLAVDMVALPCLLTLLSALVLPRKQEDD